MFLSQLYGHSERIVSKVELIFDERLSFLSNWERNTLQLAAMALKPKQGRVMQVCNDGFIYDVAVYRMFDTIGIEGFPLLEALAKR